jgi:hypothetical protein
MTFNLTILQSTDDRVFPDAYVAGVGSQKPDDPGVMIKPNKKQLHYLSDLYRSLPPNIGIILC